MTAKLDLQSSQTLGIKSGAFARVLIHLYVQGSQSCYLKREHKKC